MSTSARANVKRADPAAIEAAARLIRDGGLVAFPTETVYGLGADATSDRAVARIFEAKTRPRFNPLIVHLSGAGMAAAFAELDGRALAMAEAFWPGGLTLVLPRRENGISYLATAGLETVALRVPAHPVAQALLAAAGRPVAAPSANRSGEISPTTAGHVAASLGPAADLILDGGPCPIGIESTILDLSEGTPRLLRLGAVPVEDIEDLIGPVGAPPDGPVKAPGMLERHYAPRAPLRLNAAEVRGGEALLAFGPTPPPGAVEMLNLSPSGDLREAAANLFAMLHRLDATGCLAIAVMPVPDTGLGAAINDRLRRAAAPLGG